MELLDIVELLDIDDIDQFTVREEEGKRGNLYTVVVTATGKPVVDLRASQPMSPFDNTLTFAREEAACEWARWLNDGKGRS